MGRDDWRDTGRIFGNDFGTLGIQLSGIYGEGRLEGHWEEEGGGGEEDLRLKSNNPTLKGGEKTVLVHARPSNKL